MRLLLSLFCSLFLFTIQAQQTYEYKIDLINITDDKVSVQLITPVIKENEILFSFPKVIPGSYSEKNYGRFIESFKAFDADGKTLKTKKINPNQYLIKNAEKIRSIRYEVNDSWDVHDKDAHIFEPGGSNIDAGKNIVMNNFAFFGYFEGYNQLPLTVTITKPDYMYGATALQKKNTASITDIIQAKNFLELADNPILYCIPDTVSFMAANTRVQVSVYSANGKIKSNQVAGYLKPMAKALEQFFTTLPVENYHFLFFFDDGENPVRGKEQKGGFGALEHNYCSFYYLPEIGFEPRLKSMISDVSSHEFLHILTPLNLHSEEIENFDFTQPSMSKHLWLYEGVTEYFSHLVQLQSGIVTEDKFLKEMKDKIKEAAVMGDFSMTEMSKRVLEDKFQQKYGSVYTRGALIAFLLDLWIIEKTAGQKNLKSVIVALSKQYGKNKPFADDKLFEEIVKLSHPEVQYFLDNYIAGDKPLPYETVLPIVGYNYYVEKKVDSYILGKMALMYDDKEDAFKFIEVEQNALDIKDEDVLLSINGNAITQQNIESLLSEYLFDNFTHPLVKITVKRRGEVKELSGKMYEGYRTIKNYIELNKNRNVSTDRSRAKWLAKE